MDMVETTRHVISAEFPTRRNQRMHPRAVTMFGTSHYPAGTKNAMIERTG